MEINITINNSTVTVNNTETSDKPYQQSQDIERQIEEAMIRAISSANQLCFDKQPVVHRSKDS